jgi:hypothetical protein
LSTSIFYDQLLATIVSLRTSFRSIEDPQWRQLALMQNPLFPLPSATTMRTRLDQKRVVIEENMLSRVVPGSKIALSLDCWSSGTRVAFMGVIANYVDSKWNLIEELIGFEHLTDIHSGEALAIVVNNLLLRYQLTDRIISITTDNASNNGTMMGALNRSLVDALDKGLFLDGKIQHIPCLAHILQLAVQALLGKIRLRPTNETLIKDWKEAEQLSELEKIKVAEDRGIPYVLAKVRKSRSLIYTNPYTNRALDSKACYLSEF